jgi:hypothetical protein
MISLTLFLNSTLPSRPLSPPPPYLNPQIPLGNLYFLPTTTSIHPMLLANPDFLIPALQANEEVIDWGVKDGDEGDEGGEDEPKRRRRKSMTKMGVFLVFLCGLF